MIPPYGRWGTARIAHTPPPALPVRCPLCRINDGTHAVKGTDRRVCNDCADGIPNEMHNPPPQVLPVTT